MNFEEAHQTLLGDRRGAHGSRRWTLGRLTGQPAGLRLATAAASYLLAQAFAPGAAQAAELAPEDTPPIATAPPADTVETIIVFGRGEANEQREPKFGK